MKTFLQFVQEARTKEQQIRGQQAINDKEIYRQYKDITDPKDPGDPFKPVNLKPA